MKNKLGKTAHIEARKGSHDEARDYCRKEDTRVSGPHEYGTEPTKQQGQRNDLNLVRQRLVGGATMRDLFDDEDTFAATVRYANGIQRYYDARPQQKRNVPTVTVLWGNTGTGKTYTAMSDTRYGEPYKLNKPASDRLWWTGYNGEKTIVIDEYYGWIRWETLLNLLDPYPFSGEIKGGNVPILAENIYITSNMHPSNWYHKLFTKGKAEWATLERRLTNIIFLGLEVDGTVRAPQVEKGRLPDGYAPHPNTREPVQMAFGPDTPQQQPTYNETPNASGWEEADIPPPPTGGWEDPIAIDSIMFD